ncbi:MAG: ABC transporter ATP-binding protein [Proteobacteria bacterium]|nr:ABC transporter ATP-binding protein [Pseudomonadota bacterium]
MDDLISLKQVSFRYGWRAPCLLERIDLTLGAGMIYGLLGKNGEGKTTLFRLIAGLNPVMSGVIRTLGQDPFGRAPSLMGELFLVPEEIYFPAMKAPDYAKYYGSFYPNFSMDDFLGNLREFKVPETQTLSSMSQGQRKKAYMAFALACHTRILLMDEPTNGLDIDSKVVFRKMLAAASTPDRLIIISTHQVLDFEALINGVIVLDEHRIALCATTDRLLERFVFGTLGEDETPVYKVETHRGMRAVGLRVSTPKQGLEELDLELLFEAATHAGLADKL